MSTEAIHDPLDALRNDDSHDLALLAAQLMQRQTKESSAVETAWNLLTEAKDKIEKIRLTALAHSPEAQAEWEEHRAQQLAAMRVTYENGVYAITGAEKGRWSGKYGALDWFKRFLQWKTAKTEKAPELIDARADMWLSNYRSKGFTGEEVGKLQAEYDHWRNRGKQGQVRKKRDGRLKASRDHKTEERGQQRKDEANRAWQKLTGKKAQWEAMHNTHAELGKGSKTAVRGSSTLPRPFWDPSQAARKHPVTLLPPNPTNCGGSTLVGDKDAPKS